MSLLFIDGFDWIKNNVVAFGGGGRWTTASPSASLFDRVTPGRNGSGAAFVIEGTADLDHSIPDLTTFYVGFGFYTDSITTARGPIIEFRDAGAGNGGIHMALYIETNGTFAAIRRSEVRDRHRRGLRMGKRNSRPLRSAVALHGAVQSGV